MEPELLSVLFRAQHPCGCGEKIVEAVEVTLAVQLAVKLATQLALQLALESQVEK